MAMTKMFRDRVVSMEQTQEIGEKHLDLLKELVTEALPGWVVTEHGLDHEPDLFFLLLSHETSGETKRVSFTRMVLADAGRLPAIVEDRNALVRGRLIEILRSRAARPEIVLRAGDLLADEEQVEADAIESEWRKKHEAELAAKRLEDERREREKLRKRQEEDARRRAQREREGRERAASGSPAAQSPGGKAGHGGRRRRGRGKGGASPSAPGGGPPRPLSPPQAQERPPQGAPDQGQPQGPEGGGRRRRRRGRRGGGGGRNGGGPSAPPAPG